jgi:two-component system, NtrC family, sensor kinase
MVIMDGLEPRPSISWRELSKLMRDLSALQSPEDWIKLLKKKLKDFGPVGDPILAFVLGSGDRRFLHFRKGRVLRRRAENPWPQSVRLRRGETIDSQYLADEFDRPFSRVLAIPLTIRPSEVGELSPTLFLEHQLKPHDLESLIAYMADRLEVLNVALDRLLLEVDLKSATYLWEHTFDGLEDPVAIVDLDYRALRWNRNFSAFEGGGACHNSFADSTTACQGCPLATVIKTGEPAQGIVRRRGDTYAVYSYPILLRAGGRPTTVVHHYTRITEATALQERVVQTEKMAALGHLAGHIAHELNNPLTGIRGLAQVWLSQIPASDPVRKDFEEVERAAARSQGIIANLLDFAVVKESIDQPRTDLTSVVQRTLPLLKTALSEHSLDLEFPDGPTVALAEPQVVQQVLFNLIKNACQAMRGRGRIRISIQASGLKWELAIADSGPGIADDVKPHLFSPFVTTKPEGEGTGLGLSLSRNLIRRYGGDLTFDSQLGQGATFRISLPMGQ